MILSLIGGESLFFLSVKGNLMPLEEIFKFEGYTILLIITSSNEFGGHFKSKSKLSTTQIGLSLKNRSGLENWS